jgi:hypothetical protein
MYTANLTALHWQNFLKNPGIAYYFGLPVLEMHYGQFFKSFHIQLKCLSNPSQNPLEHLPKSWNLWSP